MGMLCCVIALLYGVCSVVLKKNDQMIFFGLQVSIYSSIYNKVNKFHVNKVNKFQNQNRNFMELSMLEYNGVWV